MLLWRMWSRQVDPELIKQTATTYLTCLTINDLMGIELSLR